MGPRATVSGPPGHCQWALRPLSVGPWAIVKGAVWSIAKALSEAFVKNMSRAPARAEDNCQEAGSWAEDGLWEAETVGVGSPPAN